MTACSRSELLIASVLGWNIPQSVFLLLEGQVGQVCLIGFLCGNKCHGVYSQWPTCCDPHFAFPFTLFPFRIAFKSLHMLSTPNTTCGRKRAHSAYNRRSPASSVLAGSGGKLKGSKHLMKPRYIVLSSLCPARSLRLCELPQKQQATRNELWNGILFFFFLLSLGGTFKA